MADRDGTGATTEDVLDRFARWFDQKAKDFGRGITVMEQSETGHWNPYDYTMADMVDEYREEEARRDG